MTSTNEAQSLPGQELHTYGPPYGAREHLQEYGNGKNLLRTKRCAQPAALKIGDVLACGDQVLSKPRQGYNGAILVHLTGGFDGHWVHVPARIPLALLNPDDEEATALREHALVLLPTPAR